MNTNTSCFIKFESGYWKRVLKQIRAIQEYEHLL